MYSTPALVYVLLGLGPLVARADLQLDADDVPAACSSVCRPVRELSRTCDVDIDDDRVSDSTEDNLQLQCLCTNNSFDVGSIAALCASCIQQNITAGDDGTDEDDDDDDDDEDDDDNDGSDGDSDDINDIMSRCGFSSTSYGASQSTAADGIVVTATRPTGASQLTTTVAGAGAGVGGTTTTTGTASPATATATATGTGTSADATPADATSTAVAVSGAAGMEPSTKAWTIMVACAVGIVAVGAW